MSKPAPVTIAVENCSCPLYEVVRKPRFSAPSEYLPAGTWNVKRPSSAVTIDTTLSLFLRVTDYDARPGEWMSANLVYYGPRNLIAPNRNFRRHGRYERRRAQQRHPDRERNEASQSQKTLSSYSLVAINCSCTRSFWPAAKRTSWPFPS